MTLLLCLQLGSVVGGQLSNISLQFCAWFATIMALPCIAATFLIPPGKAFHHSPCQTDCYHAGSAQQLVCRPDCKYRPLWGGLTQSQTPGARTVPPADIQHLQIHCPDLTCDLPPAGLGLFAGMPAVMPLHGQC